MSTDPAHHVPGRGFRNPWPVDVERVSFWRALRWMLSMHARTAHARREVPIESRAREDFEAPVSPAGVRATWLGHTAVLLQYPDATVLTDPMLGLRASPLPFIGPARETRLPVPRDALPRVDVVLLSHNHYDHLDRGSVRWLHQRDRPLFVTPLGLGGTLRRWMTDARVEELDWGGLVELPDRGLRIHAAPARHFSSRTPFDRDRTLWASYFLEPLVAGPTVYFAGDSGYAPHFVGIRERFGPPDLALVPIGAYDPRWMMKPVHLNPEEAVQASLDLGARTVLGTHCGTFILTDEPMDEPPRRFLAEATLRGLNGARMLPIGGTIEVTAGRLE